MLLTSLFAITTTAPLFIATMLGVPNVGISGFVAVLSVLAIAATTSALSTSSKIRGYVLQRLGKYFFNIIFWLPAGRLRMSRTSARTTSDSDVIHPGSRKRTFFMLLLLVGLIGLAVFVMSSIAITAPASADIYSYSGPVTPIPEFSGLAIVAFSALAASLYLLRRRRR